jgi:hypothetical protein
MSVVKGSANYFSPELVAKGFALDGIEAEVKTAAP